MNSSEKNIHLK